MVVKTEATLKETKEELNRFIRRMRRMGALDFEIKIEAADGKRTIKSRPDGRQSHVSI